MATVGGAEQRENARPSPRPPRRNGPMRPVQRVRAAAFGQTTGLPSIRGVRSAEDRRRPRPGRRMSRRTAPPIRARALVVRQEGAEVRPCGAESSLRPRPDRATMPTRGPPARKASPMEPEARLRRTCPGKKHVRARTVPSQRRQPRPAWRHPANGAGPTAKPVFVDGSRAERVRRRGLRPPASAPSPAERRRACLRRWNVLEGASARALPPPASTANPAVGRAGWSARRSIAARARGGPVRAEEPCRQAAVQHLLTTAALSPCDRSRRPPRASAGKAAGGCLRAAPVAVTGRAAAPGRGLPPAPARRDSELSCANSRARADQASTPAVRPQPRRGRRGSRKRDERLRPEDAVVATLLPRRHDPRVVAEEALE